MEKITMENFEKMLAGDEALTAKAKAITGTGEEKKQKIIDLAASLGYELDFSNGIQPLSDEEVENVAGGWHTDPKKKYRVHNCCPPDYKVKHVWQEISREEGWIWDTVEYRCARCGETQTEYFD
jgi:hypothetical protein